MKPIPYDVLRAGVLGCPDNLIYGDGQEFASVPEICAELLALREAAGDVLDTLNAWSLERKHAAALGRLRALLSTEPTT